MPPCVHVTPVLPDDPIFCFKYQRTVSNDHTVNLDGQLIQLLPARHERTYAKAIVEVHVRLDGALAIFYQGTRIPCRRLTPTPPTDRIRAHRNPHVQLDSIATLRSRRPSGAGAAVTLSRQARPGSTRTVNPVTADGRQLKQAERKPPAPDHPWRHVPVGKAKLRLTAAGGHNR